MDPAFIVQLAPGVFVDHDGRARTSAPEGALVFPAAGVSLDPVHIRNAIAELGDLALPQTELETRWGELGQDAELLAAVNQAAQLAALVFGAAVGAGTGFAGLAVFGAVVSVLTASNDLDAKYGRVLADIRGAVQGADQTRQADELLDLHAQVAAKLKSFRGELNDYMTHKPTGAARLEVYEELRGLVEELTDPLTRLEVEDWLSLYDAGAYTARFSLSPVLACVRPNGSVVPTPPQPPGPNRFDHRLGVPMLLYAAAVYTTMLHVSTPWFRSTGTYAERLRTLAAAIEAFVARMQSEGLARTEHSAQSLLGHAVFPSGLHGPFWLTYGAYYGSQVSGPTLLQETYPVGAFDLARYTDAFLSSEQFRAFAAGADYGRLATLDYTWEPPAGTVALDEAATAANEQAKADYARLMVTTGAIRLLVTAGLLRFLSTPPTASETVTGSATPSRRLESEQPTVARSPVIFPNVVIEKPARLHRYRAINRVTIVTQEPGHSPAIRYRVVLRTIDSLYGEDAWRDREYVGRVWQAEHVPLATDAQNKRLRTDFYEQLVLGQHVLYEGVAPVQPLTDRSERPVTLAAHTFDWYLPESRPPWLAAPAAATTVRDSVARTSGAASIHLRTERDAPPLMRTMGGVAPALGSVLADVDGEAVVGALAGPDLGSAERRHVRKEQVTLDWALMWKDGELNVMLSGRPGERSFQAFIVVEEGVVSGEPLSEPEHLHTPFVAEIVNQLVLVPEEFFAEERAALDTGERIWNDVLRRFSESAEVGPEDPIVAAVFEGRDALNDSRSTSTLAEVQQRRLAAAREHNAVIFEAAMGDATAT